MTVRERALSALLDDLRSGRIGPGHAVRAALSRIDATDADLRAWVSVDGAGALESVRRVPTGPLAGVPFGVKDVIDVAGRRTGCGSRLRRDHLARADAWIVAALRGAGAVPLGKTVTTEFAYFSPGPTRNPHDPTRTPGGSSSGSAAAVAAGHVPLALGSQTAGSLTRPAAYCGVTGYVAPVGRYPTDGIVGLSPTLDAVGLLTATVRDMLPVVAALDGNAAPADAAVPRLLTWDGGELADVEPPMGDAVDTVRSAASGAGAQVEPLGHSSSIVEATRLHAVVMAYEAVRLRAAEADRPNALSAPLAALFREGRETTERQYRHALDRRHALAGTLLPLLADADAILGPAATGAAPVGLGATGSPVLSRPWQLLGLPVVTVAGMRDPGGLPLGLQLIGHPDRTDRLLLAAAWVERLVADVAR